MLTVDQREPVPMWRIAGLTVILLAAYMVYYVSGAFWLFRRDVSRAGAKKVALMFLTMCAVFVLFFTLSVLVGGISRTLDATSYAGVMEAPFNLSGRPVAAPGGTYGLLPMKVGDFSWDVTTQVGPSGILDQFGVRIWSSAAALYKRPTGEAVRVMAAEVGENQVFALRKLWEYADQKGSVGNFAIGLDDSVSYLYYHVGDQDAMAWTHGSWLYIVSGASLADVNGFVAKFPY